MNITLNKLTIANFKGIKSLALDFAGENAVIAAENGIGKTTVFDAFLYLLFGKDSTGRKDFELRPLDKNNQLIKGLVLAVEGEIDFDSRIHTLRKEQHEKIVKGQIKSYETLCYIDEVPKKVGEFDVFISSIISEDTFRLLTDLYFFNSKQFGWTKRRSILLDIAGEIGTPGGFDNLIADLNGRSIDEYKQVLAEQKKRHVKERDEIGPRVDEIQHNLDEYAGADNAAIENQRQIIKTEIQLLDSQRQDLLDQEQERQGKIDKLNQLKADRIQREAELKSDTSAMQALFDEKTQISTDISSKRQSIAKMVSDLETKQSELSGKKNMLANFMSQLDSVRKDYNSISETTIETNCYACGQKLPADKLTENHEKQKAMLAEITKRGNDIKKSVDACKKIIEGIETELREQTEKTEQFRKDFEKEYFHLAQRDAEIDKALKNRPAPDFTIDLKWTQLTSEIVKAQDSIGPSISEQLQTIELERSSKQEALNQLNNALAQVDRLKKDAARIKELERNEKDLSQKITDIDRQLADIDNFKAAQSELIEESVNKKFKYVNFKLFNNLLNGGSEDCCEATYNGVPWLDLSTGQQIVCGIDIVNVLSGHYGLSVPLFIDHSESLTLPIEAKSQTICLKAVKGIKKLTVKTEGELAHV